MIAWLPDDDNSPFPSVEYALKEPDGLLAAGGSLKPARLLQAYRQGIFPWYSEEEPILWWSPSRRSVIISEKIHISRSMRRILQRGVFQFRNNTAFRQVMVACAQPRAGQSNGTWITSAMIEAYCEMHRLGHAHSFECWQNNTLVGGIYGVQLGPVFFGESMFSHVSNASKAALIYLAQQPEVKLIDCQIHSTHLASLGAQSISRAAFLEWLRFYNL